MLTNNLTAVKILADERACRLRTDAGTSRLARHARDRRRRHPQELARAQSRPLRACVPEVAT
jgi:hypothetical protein